jgi:hypothetical protein
MTNDGEGNRQVTDTHISVLGIQSASVPETAYSVGAGEVLKFETSITTARSNSSVRL